MRKWIAEGRKLWGKNSVTPMAQYNMRIRDLESTLVEILKYSTKTFTEPDKVKKNNKPASALICVAAYDNIIKAMQSHRIFERFGFDLPKRSKGGKNIKLLRTYKEWYYDGESSNWMEVEGEQTLCNFEPTNELIALIENHLDLTSN